MAKLLVEVYGELLQGKRDKLEQLEADYRKSSGGSAAAASKALVNSIWAEALSHLFCPYFKNVDSFYYGAF